MTEIAKYSVGHVSVTVAPDLSGFHKKISTATKRLKDVLIDVSPDLTEFDRKIKDVTKSRTATVNADADTGVAERKLSRLVRTRSVAIVANTKGAVVSIMALSVITDYASRKATRLGIALSAAALAAMAFNATAGAIGGIGASLAAASGAALLLPGAIGAGIAAAAALKIGFSGVGETMKAVAEGDAEKFRESLKNLAPPAREFMRVIWSMRDAFKDLQQSVQGALFRNLAGPFREMATAVLPVLKSGLTGIAEEFNVIARKSMLFFTQAGIIRDMNTQFEGTRTIVRNLGEAFTPLMRVFSTIAAVGITVLADMTSGIGDAAKGWSHFIVQARQTGQLEQWIRNGVTALGDLFASIGNIGGIISKVFGAASVEGANFFSVLRQATGEMNRFLGSAEGQNMLTSFFGGLRGAVDAMRPGLTHIREVLTNLITTISPHLPGIGEGFSAIVNAIRPFADIVINFVSWAMPGFVWFLQNVGPWLAAMLVPILAVVGAMKVYAAVQATVNAVLLAFSATPVVATIILIVVAIAALVGALIYAWNNCEWFRNAVTAAFNGIMVAVKAVGDFFVWLWQSVIVPAWNAIGAVISWAWNNVLKPIFDAIGLAVRVVIAVIFTWLVAQFLIAWNLISSAAQWYWNNVLKPVFDTFAAVARWLWNNVLRPVFGWIAAGWEGLVTAIQWLWNNVLKPAWDAVAAAARWLWNNILRPIFDWIAKAWQVNLLAMKMAWDQVLKPAWDAVSAAARWLWNNVLKPVFDFIGNAWDKLLKGMNWVWTNVLKPMFNAIRDGVDWVARGFRSAVDWIRDIWNRLIAITAKPINFVIDTVYNKGIVPAWGKIAGWLGLKGLPRAQPVKFATGGRVPGAGNRDSVPAMLMPGEYVLSKKVVNELGMDNVNRMHQGIRKGSKLGNEGLLPTQFFAAGGMVENAKRFARAQHGKPYQWGGVGNPSYDCSGFMSAIHNVLVGKAPNSRRYTTHPFEGGRPHDGFIRGLSSAFTIGVQKGHMAGTLDGMNVESAGGGVGVQAGGRARGSSSFPWKFSLPQVGGKFIDGGGGGGGFFDIVGMVVDWFRNTLMKPVMDSGKRILPRFGNTPYTQAPSKIPGKALDAGTEWVKGKAHDIWNHIAGFFGNMFGGGGGIGTPGTGPVVDQVRAVAARYGWGSGPQWAALYELVKRESSWNPNAANPTSSARGLFQKMTSIHGPVHPNPGVQAQWGLNYIKGRYGNPMNAIQHHNRMNWYSKGGPVKPNLYDRGGILPPTPNGYGLYANHSGRNEAVLTNQQMTWLRNAADNGSRNGGDIITTIHARTDATPDHIAHAMNRHVGMKLRS